MEPSKSRLRHEKRKRKRKRAIERAVALKQTPQGIAHALEHSDGVRSIDPENLERPRSAVGENGDSAGVVLKARAFLKNAGAAGAKNGSPLKRSECLLIQQAVRQKWDIKPAKVLGFVADLLETLHSEFESNQRSAVKTLVALDGAGYLTIRSPSDLCESERR